MNYSLFLDDIRDPHFEAPVGEWIICRDYDDAEECIIKNGMPSFVSFDHDLGDEYAKTGYDFCKFLVNKEMDKELSLPENFDFNVHSANFEGAKNINGYLNGYLNFKKKKFKL